MARAEQQREQAQAGVLGAQLEQLLLGLRPELDGGRHPVGVELLELVLARAPGRWPARPARGRARARLRGLLVGLLGLIAEELDDAGRVGEVVLALEQPERARAADEDVQAAVLHALEHLLDLACAADRLELLVGGATRCRTGASVSRLACRQRSIIMPVAILEDVQRHALAGQRDDAQREQRKALELVGHGGV